MHLVISRLAMTAALACGCVSGAAWAQSAPAPAPTAAQAQAFVDAAEKEAFDFSVDNARVAWINATFITDDTDAVAAEFGAKGTEMSVRFALEAAKYDKAPGLSPDLKRKLDILRTGIVLPAPTTPGAATELNEIATKLQSAYGKGMGTLDGKPINGSDIEAEMGNLKHTPGRVRRDVEELARPGRQADEGRLCPPRRDRQCRLEGAGLCRHRRDVALGL